MMEKNFTLLKLGIKYLYRYRRRYGFLLAALIFGFAIVTLITSLKDGMYEGVYLTAQAHYAGDIVAAGYSSDPAQTNHMGRNEKAAVLDAAGAIGIDPRYTVLRTLHELSGIVHYNGVAVPLKYIIGCDWEGEAHLFGKMTFDEPPEPLMGDNGIILSVPAAQMLGARMGDSVILETETRYGQRNTGPFIVKGIVRDTSIFGYYKAYVSRLSLNRLMAFDDNDCSLIGFFLNDPGTAEQKRIRLQEALAGRVRLGPLINNREEFRREKSRRGDGDFVFLYTLPVYLSEVADLLNAINIVTYFLYGMMLLIILVSAAVTYRLILHERTRELGVMRAIGFYGSDLRLVLWIEIIAVGSISLIAGFMLAGVLSWLVSLLSFSWFPGFEIFLQNGRLIALYLPQTTLINIALLFFVLIALALIPSFRVSRNNLTKLLSGELL